VRDDDLRHGRRPRAASMGAAWPRWAGRARRAARACRARRCCRALAIRPAWRSAMSWLIRWGCIGVISFQGRSGCRGTIRLPDRPGGRW